MLCFFNNALFCMFVKVCYTISTPCGIMLFMCAPKIMQNMFTKLLTQSLKYINNLFHWYLLLAHFIVDFSIYFNFPVIC